jgi:hypothetical protein
VIGLKVFNIDTNEMLPILSTILLFGVWDGVLYRPQNLVSTEKFYINGCSFSIRLSDTKVLPAMR